LGVFCIRIGNAGERPENERQLSIWLNPEDLASLIRIGLERTDLIYEVVYGISDNARAFWDNNRARELGYSPEGKAEEFAEEALKKQATLAPSELADFFQGGSFCTQEYTASFPAALRRSHGRSKNEGEH